MAIFQPQIVGKGGSNQDIQYDVMPEATIENLGRVIQYVGDTIPSTEASAIATQTVGSSLTDLVVDVEKFEEAEKPTGDCTVEFVCTGVTPEHLDPTRIWVGGCYLVIDQEKFLRQARYTWPSLDNWNITHFGVDYNDRQSESWVFVAYNNDSEIAAMGDDPTMWGVSLEGEVFSDLAFNYFTYYTKTTPVWIKNGETVNLADYGVSYTGAPSFDDTISVTYTSAISGVTKGYFYENQAEKSNPSVTISQTVGSELTNLDIDAEKFIEIEKPTEDEEVSFVYCGSIPSQLTGTVEGITATIVDVDKFMGQIHEAEQTFGFTANGFTIRVSNHGDTPATWECELEIYHDGTYGVWPIHATYPDWGIELSSESWSPTWTYYSCISNATFIAYWKKNNIENVNLSDYGITYDGSPNIDDELTVYYTAPAIIGYNWIQKDVQDQPEVGIDWKTKLDVPADYPQSYSWSCAPIYTVPGGLPDGKYEVYWQILCPKIANNENIPFGKVTYKAEFGIYTSGTTRRTYGRVSYIMDGEWLENGDYMPNNANYSNILRQNGEDLIFFSTSTIFRTTIVGNRPNTFVPECFKLSAFKNLDTGEEYVATGDLYVGINPSYTKMISGYWATSRLAEVPYVPNYRYVNSGYYDNYNQYIRLLPENCIANKINNNYAQCASIDFDIKASNGDEYHVIVENSLKKSSIAKVQKATGNLSNVQIGYDGNGYAYVYLNTPADTNDYIYYSLSLIGSERQDANCWFASGVNNFTPIAETRVGGFINEDNIGHIEQYIGETTAEYTNGYFYKATGTEVQIPNSFIIEQIEGETTNIVCNDVDAFIAYLARYTGWDEDNIKAQWNNDSNYQRFMYAPNNIDGEKISWGIYGWLPNDAIDYFTFTPSPSGAVRWNAVLLPPHKEIQNGHWEQVNVQPGSSPSYPSTMPVLLQDNWGEDQETGELVQTIENIAEVHANSVVIVAPAPLSTEDYANNEVLCIGQGEGSLIFKCATIPNNDITVNVICL